MKVNKPDEERGRAFLWIKKTVLRIQNKKDNPVYMIRYSILTTPWFAIKLHRILLSDDDCPHDHPWSFISIILWGGYVEHRADYEKMRADGRITPLGNIRWHGWGIPMVKRLYGPGSILWRPAPSIHKLEIFQPCTSLVITFRKVRVWGFHTLSGWKVWHSFIREGRKCD